MADSKKYDGSQWEHSLRKLTTATEAVENPLYSDGTAITAYTLKGNTVQNGTPSPSSPVDVVGVGERTENGFNINGTYTTRGSNSVSNNQINAKCAGSNESYMWFDDTILSGTYKLSLQFNGGLRSVRILCSKAFSGGTYNNYYGGWYAALNNGEITITVSEDFKIGFNFIGDAGATGAVYNIMLSTDTNADYEPYGYKIPISSANTTTPVYLGEVETTRKVKKLVLDGTENWNTTYGVTMVNALLTNAPFIPTIVALSDRYVYNPIQSGLSSGLRDGEFALQRAGISSSYAYNIAIKDNRYTTVTDFKTYLQQQYANGTPVTIWYVLSTPETGTVNEPLMKIGDYADTLSNAASIPTTEGANSISVDTTVQPSEFTATWTGWHNAKCKEYNYNMTIADWESASISQMENHTIQELQGGNWV